MQTKTKRAADLRRGDVVVTEDGREVRVKRDPSPAFVRGEVFVEWSSGWSSVPRTAQVEVR